MQDLKVTSFTEQNEDQNGKDNKEDQEYQAM